MSALLRACFAMLCTPLFVALFTALLGQAGLAQVATVTPAKPQAGQTLTIQYNPKAAGARLLVEEDLYAIARANLPEQQNWVIKLQRKGDSYQADFPLPPNVGYLNFYFRSINASDREQLVGTMVYRADGQPVRNGWLGKALAETSQQADFQQFFDQELSLYPDNYMAFLMKWDRLQRHKTPDALAQMKQDLVFIEQQTKQQGVEYLTVQLHLALQNSQAEAVRDLMERLLKEFPESPLTWLALNRVVSANQYGALKADFTKQFERLQWERLQQFPATYAARRHLRDFAWKTDALNDRRTFPLAALEQIAKHWMTAEPENPFPYEYLSRLYLDRQEKFAEALALSEKALAFYQANQHALFMNDGQIIETQSLLRDTLLTSAELLLRQQKLSEAYIRVKAAQTVKQESSFKSTETATYLLEGRILQAQRSFSLAERALLTAWMNGSDEAETNLREIHIKRGKAPADFAAYLRQKRDQLASNEPVPDFTVTALSGQQLSLAALKGKIVVLNFWYLGCGPCLAEIPGLNQLVAEFKDKDVVFIALAQDQAKELREFLAKKPFDYQVIPDTEALHEKFQLNLWPTHIILNRAGKVAQRLTGGGLNRHLELRRLITRALY